MNLCEKIRALPGKFTEVVRAFPVELGLCLYLFISLIFYREDILDDASFLILVPLFVGIGYILNNLLGKRFRFLYFLSWLPLVPLSFLSVWTTWLETPQCIITLCILVPLGILISRKQKDDRSFIGDLLKYN